MNYFLVYSLLMGQLHNQQTHCLAAIFELSMNYLYFDLSSNIFLALSNCIFHCYSSNSLLIRHFALCFLDTFCLIESAIHFHLLSLYVSILFQSCLVLSSKYLTETMTSLEEFTKTTLMIIHLMCPYQPECLQKIQYFLEKQ